MEFPILMSSDLIRSLVKLLLISESKILLKVFQTLILPENFKMIAKQMVIPLMFISGKEPAMLSAIKIVLTSKPKPETDLLN